jgi:cytoskeleton protein RodZ
LVSVEPASLAPFTRQPVNAAAEDEASAQEPVRLEETQTPLAEAATTVAPPPTTAERLAEASASYQPTPDAPQVTVNLAFTGDCWTEVSDAGGRRLFYDLGTEGRVVTLSGDAPIRVILGDSENVEVTVDDRLWPIPASARTGRLARLTINPR